MNKTFTFDNNIKSFERYKVNNSVITVIGEIHEPHSESNITKYIQDINNTNTIVFLELDATSIDNKIYMKGIQSSTIKHIISKFKDDNMYYFDNRNEFLGNKGHYRLYYDDIKKLDLEWYINRYRQYITSNTVLSNETPKNYEIRKTIIHELETTNNKNKKILEKNITGFNHIIKEYNHIEQRYKIDRENLKNYYQDYSDEFETFYNRDLEKINQQELELQSKIRKKIEEYRKPLVYGFREFWANVIDENLLQMIRNIINGKPTVKFEFIIIVGLQHARNLKHRFTHSPSTWMSSKKLLRKQ